MEEALGPDNTQDYYGIDTYFQGHFIKYLLVHLFVFFNYFIVSIVDPQLGFKLLRISIIKQNSKTVTRINFPNIQGISYLTRKLSPWECLTFISMTELLKKVFVTIFGIICTAIWSKMSKLFIYELYFFLKYTPKMILSKWTPFCTSHWPLEDIWESP